MVHGANYTSGNKYARVSSESWPVDGDGGRNKETTAKVFNPMSKLQHSESKRKGSIVVYQLQTVDPGGPPNGDGVSNVFL